MSFMDKEELKEKIIEILNKKGIIKAKEIANELKVNEKDVVEALLELEEDEKIEIIEALPNNMTFFDYLKNINYTFWFYGVLIGVFLTVLITLIIPSTLITYIVRVIVASLFIVFFPGYVLMELIFPRREVSLIERFALSIGLSIAIVPLIGFILNYTVKIELVQSVVSLAIFTILMSIFALIRKYKLSKEMINGVKYSSYSKEENN